MVPNALPLAIFLTFIFVHMGILWWGPERAIYYVDLASKQIHVLRENDVIPWIIAPTGFLQFGFSERCVIIAVLFHVVKPTCSKVFFSQQKLWFATLDMFDSRFYPFSFVNSAYIWHASGKINYSFAWHKELLTQRLILFLQSL